MTFGENFKKYRKNLSFTQEEIANKLMVTPQAVSKWETNLGTPDISLLIPISELFGITVDELLGKSTKTVDEIQSEIDEVDALESNITDKYNRLQKMLKSNPTSTNILITLLDIIVKILKHRKSQLSPDDVKEYVKDAEIYSKVLIERADLLGYDKHGYGLLAQVYMYAEDYNRAKSTIENLPWTRFNQFRSKGDLAFLQSDYKTARIEYGKSIKGSLSWIFYELQQLYLTYSKTDMFKAKVYIETMYNLHKTFFNSKEDICLSWSLRFACMELAVFYANWDDKNIALDYLKEYADSIIKQKHYYENNISDECKLFPENEWTLGKINLNKVKRKLLQKGLDPIRQDERFKSVLKQIEIEI